MRWGHTVSMARSPSYKFMRRKPLPSISSESTMSHLSSPWYEELVSGLMEQAISLLICKKLKGSRISLSSEINWNCLLCNLEEAKRVHWASCQVARSTFQLSDTSHQASHHSTICHSPESLSMLPPAATWEDQAKAAEPCLSSEWSRSPPAQGSPSTPRCPSPALAPVHFRKRCTRTRLRMSPRALPSLKWQRRKLADCSLSTSWNQVQQIGLSSENLKLKTDCGQEVEDPGVASIKGPKHLPTG
ncbi:Coiled-coil domain-containing protein 116 [Manis javanica]|nr:Coiled-coil domain-containing protein 116 [Manis javanica]